jgi:antitoxin MazE
MKMKTTKGRERVGLLVSKWGNSLALRLPAELAKQLGVGEGDTLIGEIAPDGRLIISAEARTVGKAEVRRMREFIARQEVTVPVVGDMRRSARY